MGPLFDGNNSAFYFLTWGDRLWKPSQSCLSQPQPLSPQQWWQLIRNTLSWCSIIHILSKSTLSLSLFIRLRSRSGMFQKSPKSRDSTSALQHLRCSTCSSIFLALTDLQKWAVTNLCPLDCKLLPHQHFIALAEYNVP